MNVGKSILVRAAFTCVAGIALWLNQGFVKDVGERMYERTITEPHDPLLLSGGETFRDGYLEALAVARLDVPYDVPDRGVEFGMDFIGSLRELTEEQSLP